MINNFINYGIIGFGEYAKRRLIPAFRGSKHSRLLAISRRQLENAQQSAQEYNIPYYYSSPADLVNNPEISAVVIATPPVFHYDHSLLAARNHKHVLLEKPMTTRAKEMAALRAECRRQQVKLMAGYVMRFIDAVQTTKELIRNNLLGKLSYAGGVLGINAALITREWLEDPVTSGGGVVADLGSHMLDLLEFITERKIKKLMPLLQPIYSNKAIDKNAIIGLEFENGLVGSLFLSFTILRESGLTFRGSKGKLSLQNFNRPETTVELQLTTERGTEKIQVLNRNYYATMLDHFSRAILFDESILTPPEVGWHNQRLIDRIYKIK